MEPSVPTALPSYTLMPGTITVEGIISVVILLVFVWWAIYTIVVTYHWFRYGRDSWLAVPSVVLHLAISIWIFVFATGGFH